MAPTAQTAAPELARRSRGLTTVKRNVASFKVLGVADGRRCLCALCRRGGPGRLWIKHYGHVDSWHVNCAREYFQAPIPPVPEEAATES
jgi:hypothetical protein